MKRKLNIFRMLEDMTLALIITVQFPLGSYAQEIYSYKEYTGFSKWGLSVEIPSEWRQHSSDDVASMRRYISTELDRQGKYLLAVDMVDAQNDEISMIITKCMLPKVETIPELIKERKLVYKDAKKLGDVTKVNHVKETRIDNLPAIEEDVERSNGGRGISYKIINGTFIYEISLIVKNTSQFSKYSKVIDHIVSKTKVDRQKDQSPMKGKKK